MALLHLKSFLFIEILLGMREEQVVELVYIVIHMDLV